MLQLFNSGSTPMAWIFDSYMCDLFYYLHFLLLLLVSVVPNRSLKSQIEEYIFIETFDVLVCVSVYLKLGVTFFFVGWVYTSLEI